ncbi:MAG: glycosyltransferase family 2 protein [Solirubrobacteraceae bacterium]
MSTVVCAYSDERRAALLEAIGSLAAQTLSPAEVIVVVDHNPALLHWVRACAPEVMAVVGRPPRLTVIASEQVRGLAGARNTGVLAASGDVVSFLDDDARAAPDWVWRLCSAYGEPRVLGVGGAVVPEFERGRPRWMPEEFDWVVGCTYLGLPAAIAPVRNLIGCNMSLRREPVVAAGGFRNGMGRRGADGVGCEETELCIRIARRQPGSVFLYDPEARVSHRVPAKRASMRYFLARCKAEGLSKAEVARCCGLSGATGSERAYVRRTLPAGIRAGLGDLLRGDPFGLARAGAIVLGASAAAAGFAMTPRWWHGIPRPVDGIAVAVE